VDSSKDGVALMDVSSKLTCKKKQTSAPSSAIKSVMLLCIIDVKEEQDMATTVDIPGAFIQADMEGNDIHLMLEGTIADLLVHLDLKPYRKYVKNRNGKPVLYVQLTKALYYGTLQAALLFWKDLSASLQEWGFNIREKDNLRFFLQCNFVPYLRVKSAVP
jgi:hypothetical protein